MLADLWEGFIDAEPRQQGPSGGPEQNSVWRVDGDAVLLTHRQTHAIEIRLGNPLHTSFKAAASSLFNPHLALSIDALGCGERADAKEDLQVFLLPAAGTL